MDLTVVVRQTMESAAAVSIVPVGCSLRKMVRTEVKVQAIAVAVTVTAPSNQAIVEYSLRNQELVNARNSHFMHTIARTTKFEYSSRTTNFPEPIIAEFEHGVLASSKPSGITI